MERQPDHDHFLAACRFADIRNPLDNIHNYNDKMTISQVVRFFERQDIHFTKTMIQNYVRHSVIPPPHEKRYYTKEHLIMLVIIDSVKEVYSLEEIKNIFPPAPLAADNENGASMTELYAQLLQIYQSAVKDWIASVPNLMEKAAVHIRNSGMEGNRKAQDRMTVYMLMAQSAAITKSIRVFMEKIDL